MNKEISQYNLHSEEFFQIIKAILLGKYAWACILFLHFLGYNPTEYIPYQTYLQAIKDKYLPGMANFTKIEDNNLKLHNMVSDLENL